MDTENNRKQKIKHGVSIKHTTNKNHTVIESLRAKLVNDVFLGLGIAAIPSLAISLWRSIFINFQLFMLVQIILVAILWICWLSRHQLSYLVKVTSLLTILWIASFAALFQLGPVSDSKVFIVLFAFTSMLFLRPLIACLLITAITFNIMILGYAATQQWIIFSLDYSSYSAHPLSWLLLTWNMGVFSAIVAYLGWQMIFGLRNLSDKSDALALRHKKITERIPGLVYQYRLRPDGSACFPYASEGIETIFRVSAESVKEDATSVMALVHPDDIAELSKKINESAQALTPWQMEYRVCYSNGDFSWLSGNSTPEVEPDGSILWHGVIIDISDRKKAENIKEDFVSTVNHELRTPLTAISGALKLINSGVLDQAADKKQNMLEVAEKNTERLLFLINDLLDIDKIEKGKLNLHYSKVSMQTLLEQCVEENQAFAAQYNVELTITAFAPCNISVDEDRLKQVITNLLSNACKYSPANDEVVIHVEHDEKNISITVTDHGPGIPEQYKASVFEKFTQADNSNTRELGGTGLGLSISKKIVELHKGNISFNSEPYKATSFTVTLPLISP